MTNLFLGLFSGIAFGFVIQRIGATNANKMAKVHLMIEPSIPQFVLLAVALSAAGLLGLTSVGVGRTLVLPTSILATGVAAVIFGVGWGLAGYCPGTAWAAAGEGRMDAVFAVLGGFTGTAVFAHFHGPLVSLLYAPTNIGRVTLTDWIGHHALSVVFLFGGFSVFAWLIGKIWRGHGSG
jgi:hypothetical protein